MKTFLLLTLALLLVPGLIRGEDPATTDAPDNQADYNQIITNFFVQVKAEKFTEAAHVLVDTNPEDAFNVEKHEALAVPMQKISENFGAFKKFTPLVSKNLGDAIGYVYGMGIYEKSPVRFEFMFFKDDNHWRMLHVDFSLNFAEEIREMAGVHFPPAPVPVIATPAASATPEPVKPQPTATPIPSSPSAPNP